MAEENLHQNQALRLHARHWNSNGGNYPKRCCGGFLKNSDFIGGSEFGNPYFPGTSFPPLKISNGELMAKPSGNKISPSLEFRTR